MGRTAVIEPSGNTIVLTEERAMPLEVTTIALPRRFACAA